MPSPTDATPGSYIDLSGNNLIDSLVAGTKWGSGAGTYASLTYSFFVSGQSYYATNYSDDNEYLAAYVLSIKQQTAITNALQKWSTVANLTFSQVSDSMTSTGDLRFSGYVNMPNDVAAWAYYPSQSPSGGDTWVGPSTAEETPTPGTYDFMTFTHEIGHAIGLKHPFESEPDNNNTLPAAYDDVRYTVMSYNNSYDFEPTGPMLLDIAAIQYIYGKNLAWQTGNNTYKWAADARIFETLWDAGGTDTIDASNQTRGVGINLNSGEFSSIGQGIYSYDKGTYINNCLNIAYGCTIENAIGSNFNDTIIGNAVANILNGGTGNDTLIGGLGNDTYVVNIATDVISETSTLASEIDTV
ncbi:MAG: M10 family metallopeptidase, partial [Pseudomonadales bacterium]|nr:M10 family metallopeptidase [Pseudomonadales bacterium]